MKSIFPSSPAAEDQIQSRLLYAALVFLIIHALIFSLAPIVRSRGLDVTFNFTQWLGIVVWVGCFSYLHKQSQKRLPNRDPYLIPVFGFLTGLGLLTIFRLLPSYGIRQSVWLILSSSVIIFFIRTPNFLLWLRRYKYIWLICGLIVTALTFIVGIYPGGVGPRLWLGCCGVYLQPSEPLKLLLIVYLAAYLADRVLLKINFVKLILPTLILTGLALAILFAQRDLGTTTVFFLLYFTMIFLATEDKKVLIIGSILILIAGIIGMLYVEVIRYRVEAWINPWLDPSGKSYQIVQSLIAVASGGLLGRGIGIGNPVVVPVAISDFIFSAIAEETGLIGSIGLIILFTILIHRGFKIASRAVNNYHRYLAAGITAFLGIQFILIVGGNLRMLPLTGVTLPFVSYGGSSLLTCSIGIVSLLLISNIGEVEPAKMVNKQPYILISMVLLSGFAVLALLSGWWSVVRSENLVNRTDNPRRAINDLYVKRGWLLDRNNQALALTTGTPGRYARVVTYPSLGATLGYLSPTYGQAGLEASLDPYLRGLRGNTSSSIWFNNLIYGSPPPGLDVRLSLDLELQNTADDLLRGHSGAIVMMNASNGELLVVASHPYFDPNQIDSNWSQWINEVEAPLVNRATQSKYPLGTAQSVFLLAVTDSLESLPPLPDQLTAAIGDSVLTCASSFSGDVDWNHALVNGCPGPVLELSKQFSASELITIYKTFGFTSSSSLPLLQADPDVIQLLEEPSKAALGIDQIKVTPLQAAIAAATISSDGKKPAPVITLAVNTPTQGWVIFPRSSSTAIINANNAQATADFLSIDGKPFWQTTGLSFTENLPVTWFIAGTTGNWKGTPLSVVVLLEEDDPETARSIGSDLINAVLKQAE